MTGIETVSATCAMASQSAIPEYPCSLVRPWTATAAIPTCSRIVAVVVALIVSELHPRRILAVTGNGSDRFHHGRGNSFQERTISQQSGSTMFSRPLY